MIDDETFERRTVGAITAVTDAVHELYAEAIGARAQATRYSDALGEAHLRITKLRRALVAAYDTHRRVECPTDDLNHSIECTCQAFDETRELLKEILP